MNCERNRNKTKIFFAKALFALIAKKIEFGICKEIENSVPTNFLFL